MADFTDVAAQVLAASVPSPVVARSSVGETMLGTLLHGVEVNGMAGLMGLLNGLNPSQGKNYHETFGVPTDLGLGLGLLLISFFGGGKYFEHGLSLANGTMASFWNRYGYERGVAIRNAKISVQQVQTQQVQQPQQTTAGQIDAVKSMTQFERPAPYAKVV